MEIDQNYLRTVTAIGYRASHEHQLRFFVMKARATVVSGSKKV